MKQKLVIPMSNDQKSTPISKLMEERKLIAKNRGIKREIKTEPVDDVEMKEEPAAEPQNETLEQQAARELVEDLQAKVVKTEVKVFEVPINPDELPLEGAKESSLDDYDKVPITDFGKAMLRGMGWKDEEKDDSKKIDLDGPILRPKGMGLGADKVIKKQPLLVAPNQSETLEIKRHACVKVLAGKHKNLYGTVRNFINLQSFHVKQIVDNISHCFLVSGQANLLFIGQLSIWLYKESHWILEVDRNSKGCHCESKLSMF